MRLRTHRFPKERAPTKATPTPLPATSAENGTVLGVLVWVWMWVLVRVLVRVRVGLRRSFYDFGLDCASIYSRNFWWATPRPLPDTLLLLLLLSSHLPFPRTECAEGAL